MNASFFIQNVENYSLNINALRILSLYIEEYRKNQRDVVEDNLNIILENLFTKRKLLVPTSEYETLVRSHVLFTYQFDYLFLNSIFLMAYSLFEKTFSQTCHLCCQEKIINKPFTNKKNSTIIESMRHYLNDTLKLPTSLNTNPLWKQINTFRQIRNSIIHANDSGNNYYSKVFPLTIKKMKGIELIHGDSGHHSLNITTIEFLNSFISTSSEYLQNITNEIVENS